METKIAEVKGYTITYDAKNKEFYLVDSNGDHVGSGKTQDEVEVQADKLSKQQYKFPIEALKVSNLWLYSGRVTSINITDKSIRFVQDKESEGYYSGSHTKEHLRYSHVYEATQANKDISDQVATRRNRIKTLEEEIKGLLGQLESPISLDYFNLKDSY